LHEAWEKVRKYKNNTGAFIIKTKEIIDKVRYIVLIVLIIKDENKIFYFNTHLLYYLIKEGDIIACLVINEY